MCKFPYSKLSLYFPGEKQGRSGNSILEFTVPVQKSHNCINNGLKTLKRLHGLAHCMENSLSLPKSSCTVP